MEPKDITVNTIKESFSDLKFPIRYYFLDEDDTVLDTMELTIDPEGEFSPYEMAIRYRDETWPGKEIAVTVVETKE